MIIFLNILRLTSDEEAEGFPIQVTPTIVNLHPLENCLLESYGTIFAQNRKKNSFGISYDFTSIQFRLKQNFLHI